MSSKQLKEYQKVCLRYRKYPHVLEGYSDANWSANFEE